MRDTPTPAPVQLAPLGDGMPGGDAGDLAVIAGVALEIVVVLGRARLTVQELLQLRSGSVIELGPAGGLVEVLANGTLVARGEVVVVGDDLGVRITEILPPRRM
jgi:flagellar motor switch protein FliN/FliY